MLAMKNLEREKTFSFLEKNLDGRFLWFSKFLKRIMQYYGIFVLKSSEFNPINELLFSPEMNRKPR